MLINPQKTRNGGIGRRKSIKEESQREQSIKKILKKNIGQKFKGPKGKIKK